MDSARARASSAARRDAGFTVGELLVVVAITMVIGAIATAMLMRARMASNETAAIGSMRSIVSAQASYGASNNGFAASLEALGGRCPGMSQGFLSQELSQNGQMLNGYVFNVRPGASSTAVTPDCNGLQSYTAFYASAAPETVGSTGSRAFAANTTSAVWQSTSGNPPVEPFRVGGSVTMVGR